MPICASGADVRYHPYQVIWVEAAAAEDSGSILSTWAHANVGLAAAAAGCTCIALGLGIMGSGLGRFLVVSVDRAQWATQHV